MNDNGKRLITEDECRKYRMKQERINYEILERLYDIQTEVHDNPGDVPPPSRRFAPSISIPIPLTNRDARIPTTGDKSVIIMTLVVVVLLTILVIACASGFI